MGSDLRRAVGRFARGQQDGCPEVDGASTLRGSGSLWFLGTGCRHSPSTTSLREWRGAMPSLEDIARGHQHVWKRQGFESGSSNSLSLQHQVSKVSSELASEGSEMSGCESETKDVATSSSVVQVPSSRLFLLRRHTKVLALPR